MEAPRNIPASVRQRLLDKSRRDSRPFMEVLQYFAMERFLYRLSRSSHAGNFILKGAMALNAWGTAESRSTKDIDLLGKIINTENEVQKAIEMVLGIPCPEDGITFDPSTITTSRIAEEAEYHGVRVSFLARLDAARITMKIDVGFGDQIFPDPERLPFPTLLDLPAPELLCYRRETAIAEKCQAMAALGDLNSRMKDFFDVWLLSRQFDYDATTLRKAIHVTFETRGTSLTGLGVFSTGFDQAKQVQWKAFRSRMKLQHAPEPFTDILKQLAIFLAPCGVAGIEGEYAAHWIAPGPWLPSRRDSGPHCEKRR